MKSSVLPRSMGWMAILCLVWSVPIFALAHGKADTTKWKNVPVQPRTVLVKFASSVSTSLLPSSVSLRNLNVPFARYGVVDVRPLYPSLQAARISGEAVPGGIDRLYRISYTTDEDPRTVALDLSTEFGVEYAEPEAIHQVGQTPNDPYLNQQYAVDKIQAKEAWDLTKGDPSILIAIVDSGVRWTHEDLKENIWINSGEDVNKDGRYTVVDQNGVDDDANGYIDDIVGIDFVGDSETNGGSYYDANPAPTDNGNPHGTHVAGIAAASGNNGLGIAGIAWRCKILPVKCGSDNGGTSIIRGYDGIVYAALMGAKVINCSWGGGGYMQNEIDRINFAISRGAVVVAAAGNDYEERGTTPGAYPNVLCVANVDGRDIVNPSSTYGAQVDVSAPGTSILSTVSNSDAAYESIGWSGTSMASPMVAGVVALTAAAFPSLTPMQISEKVRVSSENIDSLQHPRYAGKIGHGRINALRALTVTSPAVRISSWRLDDSRLGNGNGILERGEQVEVFVTWRNYLDPTTQAVTAISSTNPRVIVMNGNYTIGALGTLDSASNSAAPFVLRLSNDVAPNDRIDFLVTVNDGAYQDKDGFFVYQQPTYRDHNVNEILTTLSNLGHIGFDDFSTTMGRGFILQKHGVNVLFEGGLMIGARVNNLPRVVDVVRDETGQQQMRDFLGATEFLMRTPGFLADQEGKTRLTDDGADERERLGVDVSVQSFAFTSAQLARSILLKYTIRNTSGGRLDDLHAGLFFDWDIGPSSQADRAVYDTASRLAMVYDTKGEVKTQVGVTVLSRSMPALYTGIENGGSDNLPVFGIYNGFTKTEKWSALTAGIIQPFTKATDVSHVVSTGPVTLEVGDSIVVGFAICAGESFEDLRASASAAQDIWSTVLSPTTSAALPSTPSVFSLRSVFPQPWGSGFQPLSADFTSSFHGPATLALFDLQGRVISRRDIIAELGSNTVAVPLPMSLPPGLYYLEIGNGVHRAGTAVIVSSH